MRRSMPPEWNRPIVLDAETSAALSRTQERMTQVPGEIRELSVNFAKRGWYVWLDMPFTFLYSLRAGLKQRHFEAVDAAMARYFKSEGRRIESCIIEAFPKRKTILSASFRAHRREDYALAVPVFLSQADGICAELIGVGFYSRKKGVPRTASAVARLMEDEFMSSILEPLRVAGALNAFEDERHQYPDVLNRHEVLHGKSIDYATALNSFRAFSLLAYLASVLPTAIEYKEYRDEEKASITSNETEKAS